MIQPPLLWMENASMIKLLRDAHNSGPNTLLIQDMEKPQYIYIIIVIIAMMDTTPFIVMPACSEFVIGIS